MLEARIITFGARVVSIAAPDRNGKIANVVLGYSALDGYEADKNYFGAIVGRYGNRIGNGRFTLEGHEIMCRLITMGSRCMVGRSASTSVQASQSAGGVEMTLVSKDGDRVIRDAYGACAIHAAP